MKNYLKLFRFQNLIIIAITQYFLRYFIISPILAKNQIAFSFSHFDFFLLVFSTVIIAAAGYAINDYFDIEIDKVNKPDKIVVESKISRRKVILIHSLLSLIGVFIGFYLSYVVGRPLLGFINLATVILLFVYSTHFKRSFFTGNFIVSFLSAVVLLIVWLFDYYSLVKQGVSYIADFHVIRNFVYSYSFFAFAVSLLREVVKDIEDIQGDLKLNCKTVPIVIGINKTKQITIAFTVILLFFIGYIQMYIVDLSYYILFIYSFVTLEFLLIFFIIKLFHSREKEDFNLLSQVSKLIMLAGIITMPIYYIYLK